MLTARAVIVSTIAVAVLCVLVGLISLIAPMEDRSEGENFYGTGRTGYRGLYELLKALDLPTVRMERPPSEFVSSNATLVFLNSQQSLARLEPAYLHEVADWVRSGGRVVVAPAAPDDDPYERFRLEEEELDRNMFLELGVDGVEVMSVTKNGDLWDFDRPYTGKSDEELYRLLMDEPTETVSVEAKTDGTLSYLSEFAPKIEIPVRNLGLLDLIDAEPSGRVFFTSEEDGETLEWIVAASFRVGEGEVVLVSEPRLADNDLLVANSPFWVHLLAEGNRSLFLDGFYHGLTVRGNPIWLLGRFPYGILVATIALGAGIWAWREAIFLGPPLAAPAVSRRNILEYVDAMSQCLIRSKDHTRFLLQEVRDGVVRSLKAQLGVAGNARELESIETALRRRNPEKAKQFREAVGEIDAMLAGHQRVHATQAIQAMKRIAECQ